jgi:fatty acid synthase subunit alpha, fungi type
MFQKHHYLMFPSKSIHTDGVRAGVMVGIISHGSHARLLITSLKSSFGFGQVGGTALVVHPRYLFGALEPSAYETYKCKNVVRAQQAYKSMSEMMITNSLVKIKESPPYTPELEVPVLINSMARATLDAKTGSYSFPKKLVKESASDKSNAKTVADIMGGSESAVGVGVDQGMSHSFVPSTTRLNLFKQSSSLPFPLTTPLLSRVTSRLPK